MALRDAAGLSDSIDHSTEDQVFSPSVPVRDGRLAALMMMMMMMMSGLDGAGHKASASR